MVMHTLRWLFGVKRDAPSEAPPPRPERAEARAPADDSGASERFRFRENASAKVNANVKIAQRHSPPPARAVVEVMDAAGRLLAMDLFEASAVAPGGAWKPNGAPATLVRDGGTNRCHQFLQCDIADSPVALPEHLLDKKDARTIRLWWSCHAQ